MRPFAWSSIFSIEVTPVSAALMVLMLWPIESLSCERSSARRFNPFEAKNATAPSMAELILLPVASRCCVRSIFSDVNCSSSRLLRMPAVN